MRKIMDNQLVPQEILDALNEASYIEVVTPNKLIWMKSQEEYAAYLKNNAPANDL